MTLELRHIVTPIRTQLHRTRFILGETVRIDLDAREIEARHPITNDVTRLTYDQLVLALGSVTSTFGIPGVDEYTLPLKTVEDAEVLRNRVIAALEQAVVTPPGHERDSLLTFVVVGGGYTGCEAAGELVDLFHSIIRYYPPLRLADVRMILIEAGKALLPDLPPAMGRYTAHNLARRKVELVIGDGVTEVGPRGIRLHSGTEIATATVVWSAGVRPSPILKDLAGVEHARGIVVRPDMSVIGRPGVWAIGDCAWIPTKPGAEQSDRNAWYPATAQHAIREGPVLADNIVATLRGQPTNHLRTPRLGRWRRSAAGAASRRCPAASSSPGSWHGSCGVRITSHAFPGSIVACA